MIRSLEGGAAVAVSDGVGSCPHAEVGSRAACRAVIDAAAVHLRHHPVTLAGLPALVQHLWRLKLSGHVPADCSATCLFVTTCAGVGTLLAQLGDGLIAACADDGSVDLLMADKSESFANLTAGLGSQGAARWQTVIVPAERYSSFVLCTDGVAEDLEPATLCDFARGVSDHYRNYSRRTRRREVQRWLRNWPVAGHTDDKTIACLYRVEGSA